MKRIIPSTTKTLAGFLVFTIFITTGAVCKQTASSIQMKPVTLNIWGVWDTSNNFSQIIKDYKKIFPKEFENTEFSNLNMPYQRYLKKKYYNYKRKNNFIIYVSSNLNIKEELKGINKLLNSKFYIPNKKIYFLLHPRENIKKWRQLNRDFKNIKLIKKQKYYSSNNYKYVFGITTAALINYKFIGGDGNCDKKQ